MNGSSYDDLDLRDSNGFHICHRIIEQESFSLLLHSHIPIPKIEVIETRTQSQV